MKLNAKHTDPLPFKFYFLPVCLLVVVGLAASSYLSFSHYRVYTDIGYSSFCAISKAVNCDTVSQSPYSIFMGLPVPLWGVIGYVLLAAFVLSAGWSGNRPERLWRILFLVSAVFSAISILLALISSFVIHSYCVMCIVTYGVNFGLLFYTWLIPSRFDPQPFYKGLVEDVRLVIRQRNFFGGTAGALSVALLLSWILIPAYWHFTPPIHAANVPRGFTEEGHPWIGAENPKITIVEFADYQCFQCKKMHFHLRSLINQHPDHIRLVHRHYPMDHSVNPVVKEPFHEGAAVMATLAIQAGYKGKFWEANDALYGLVEDQADVIKTEDLAKSIGLNPQDLSAAFDDPKPFQKMIRDIRAGMKLGLSGTPSYVIENVVYEGGIPADILANILSVDPIEHNGGNTN